jgi:hypothetical protein
MELYSGPKRVNEKDLKTKYLRSKNQEFTVFLSEKHEEYKKHGTVFLSSSCQYLDVHGSGIIAGVFQSFTII